jgi:hypothetical protein
MVGKLKIDIFETDIGAFISQQIIESNGRVAISFLRFQGSRRETCPLRCSPDPLDREPGLPPQISHEKTAPSASAELAAGRQSLRKDIATLPCLEHQHYFAATNSCEEPKIFTRAVTFVSIMRYKRIYG